MAIIENKYDFRMFVFVIISTLIVLFLGIYFDFLGKILMIAGALYLTKESLSYLGIIDYLYHSKVERKARKQKNKQERKEAIRNAKKRSKTNI